MNQTSSQRRERRIAVGLAVLFAVVMVSLGVWSITSGFAIGTTKKSAVVAFAGAPARWIGAVQASIGLLPLAIAMPTKRIAVRWVVVWLGLTITCLIAALVQS